MSSPRIARLVLAPFGLAALCLAACRMGDVAGNVTRNAFGGSGRASDILAAGITSLEDIHRQMSVQFSPEQEHYLGRAVAANVIAQFGLDPDEGRQAYVRRVGAALVLAAPRVRTTYGGWHFGVLASPAVNGLSGPGGYVFVTRGALDLCRSEDELAGLLAHEMSHVSLKHGEAIVRASNDFKVHMGALGRVAGAAVGGARFSDRMLDVFRSAANGLSKSLIENGYGGELEAKADTEGTYILFQAGYDAGALSAYLAAMPSRQVNAWSAHPSNVERVSALAGIVASYGGRFDPAGTAPRGARFAIAMGAARVVPAAPPAAPSPAGSSPAADKPSGG
jgi:predicted Zn-dependent protease